MTTLSLQSGILYGPVASRRLGRSLGINLSPRRRKLCSFDCVYCHYGRTERLTSKCSSAMTGIPPSDEVIAAVGDALSGPRPFDVLTFSGNGEPTLHPEFSRIVDGVLEHRDRYRPGTRVALLTNSSGLQRSGVREAISRLDPAICKLDAGTEDGFRGINRPAPGITLEAIVDGLVGMNGAIVLQTLLVRGEVSNFGPREVEAYLEKVRRVDPREVQVYSIDRPVASRKLVKVEPEDLTGFAEEAARSTGVAFRAYSAPRAAAGVQGRQALARAMPALERG
jgi:wyosine [tRNA(Phe)-imidazoG37] synthetase (radical SAM superfamily)